MIELVIREEAADDLEPIRRVHRLAFDGDEEARLVDALRAEGYVRTSLVAEAEGRVIGHIMFSDLPILAPEATIPALPLAPLAGHLRRSRGRKSVPHWSVRASVLPHARSPDRGRPWTSRVLPSVRVFCKAGWTAEVTILG